MMQDSPNKHGVMGSKSVGRAAAAAVSLCHERLSDGCGCRQGGPCAPASGKRDGGTPRYA